MNLRISVKMSVSVIRSMEISMSRNMWINMRMRISISENVNEGVTTERNEGMRLLSTNNHVHNFEKEIFLSVQPLDFSMSMPSVSSKRI